MDGFTVAASALTGDAPHGGEVHPDGDELLYLISGAVTVTLELGDGDRLVHLGAGDAVVVPKGVRHQITMRDQPADPYHARTERRRTATRRLRTMTARPECFEAPHPRDWAARYVHNDNLHHWRRAVGRRSRR